MTIDFEPTKYGVLLWFAGQEGCWGIGDAEDLSDLFARVDQLLDILVTSPQARMAPQPELRMTFLNRAVQHAGTATVEIERIYRFKLRSSVSHRGTSSFE